MTQAASTSGWHRQRKREPDRQARTQTGGDWLPARMVNVTEESVSPASKRAASWPWMQAPRAADARTAQQVKICKARSIGFRRDAKRVKVDRKHHDLLSMTAWRRGGG